jgi:hypothetical protein
VGLRLDAFAPEAIPNAIKTRTGIPSATRPARTLTSVIRCLPTNALSLFYVANDEQQNASEGPVSHWYRRGDIAREYT